MDVETTTKDRGTILAEERTNLAVERSVMAAERIAAQNKPDPEDEGGHRPTLPRRQNPVLYVEWFPSDGLEAEF